MLFSEIKNAGGAGLWEDDMFKLGHVQFNVLWDIELWKPIPGAPAPALQFLVM